MGELTGCGLPVSPTRFSLSLSLRSRGSMLRFFVVFVGYDNLRRLLLCTVSERHAAPPLINLTYINHCSTQVVRFK